MKKWILLLLLLLPSVLIPGLASGASVTLHWTPPDVSCDGSPLDDLAGYIIFWGTTHGSYQWEHHVDDPSATSATINVGSVEDATLYFTAVSFDVNGNRSDDPGGCGTSNELQVSFGSVSPSPPIGLTVVSQ